MIIDPIKPLWLFWREYSLWPIQLSVVSILFSARPGFQLINCLEPAVAFPLLKPSSSSSPLGIRDVRNHLISSEVTREKSLTFARGPLDKPTRVRLDQLLSSLTCSAHTLANGKKVWGVETARSYLFGPDDDDETRPSKEAPPHV